MSGSLRGSDPLIAWITAFPDLPTNRRLADAADARSVPWVALAPTGDIPDHRPAAVLLRVGLSERQSAFQLATRLADRGTRLLNSVNGCTRAKDKWLTHCTLDSDGLPQVPTRLLEPGQRLASVLPDEQLGRFPLVVKTRLGTKGVGVHLAHDIEELSDLRARYARDGFAVLLQRLVRPDRELRVLVLADEVLAAFERRPEEGEFRANWHRGATLVPVDPVPGQVGALAREAARELGLGFAGVDILETDGLLQVLEVNDAPGLEGAEQATERDLAGAVVDALVDLTRR